VCIGNVPLGGCHPIRIQSMTTANTMDTEATVNECIRIIEAGSEYVRITAPSIREAENLKNIKDSLRRKGYKSPLIADIHFTPNAAIAAAQIVEKVRINPGNYADKKKFRQIEYNDESYNAELERIHERFSPLVRICKEHGTAMRIGTNHGSLSDRIMSRYGDTPLGMVESAMEFIRICEANNYYDIVLSMKSSNPVVMVHAYRLLVQRMNEVGMSYPLHLGVTEAGEGEDGRIKSALGIGTLLDDGLGDTIRVSLTEPPENEILSARRIISRYETLKSSKPAVPEIILPYDPFSYNKRVTDKIGNIGGSEVPRVLFDLSERSPDYGDFAAIGHEFNFSDNSWKALDAAADYVYLGKNELKTETPPETGLIFDYETWKTPEKRDNGHPLYTLGEYYEAEERSPVMNFILVPLSDFDISAIEGLSRAVLILQADKNQRLGEFRRVFFELFEWGIRIPVVFGRDYSGCDTEDIQVNGAVDIGGLLLDGLGDGVFVSPAESDVTSTVFGILQAGRTRIYKADYISCPSCGRTHFDLRETSARIRSVTDHLKGIKIGIMGCIVNGPGEMADADFGYVGTGPGKIALYRGKEVVKGNIPEQNAVDMLIELIKSDGKWIDRS